MTGREALLKFLPEEIIPDVEKELSRLDEEMGDIDLIGDNLDTSRDAGESIPEN